MSGLTAYVVRLNADEKYAHEIVGVYAVRCLEDLRCLVDEVCDPNVCEYRRLPPGGIEWPMRSKVVPPREEDDSHLIHPHDARFDERWSESINDRSAAQWKPLCPKDWVTALGFVDDWIKWKEARERAAQARQSQQS